MLRTANVLFLQIYLKMSHDEPQTEFMMLDYVTLAAGRSFLHIIVRMIFQREIFITFSMVQWEKYLIRQLNYLYQRFCAFHINILKQFICIWWSFIAGAVFLTVRAILFFELYSVYRNFNQGLKERGKCVFI